MPHNTFHYIDYENPVSLRGRLRDLHLSDFPTNASKVKIKSCKHYNTTLSFREDDTKSSRSSDRATS